MIWTGASWLLMAFVLAVGIVWYERTKPSARSVALIAALAGLAALGRIVFAPIPNVKPTTDIVLLAGFALGGAPGFMVGAASAFAANFFFGQGPWTLWQMLAWGSVGVTGAVAARALKQRLGRVGLAALCAFAGVIYAVIINFSSWITFAGDLNSGTLVAYYVTSVPFDLAHIIGNVIFCVAFGPALVAALKRHELRTKVKWSSPTPSPPRPTSPIAGELRK